jgi:hypothetical protein
MLEFSIQCGPPGPKCFYIRVVITGRDRPAAAAKMLRSVMRNQSRKCPMAVNFLLPARAELRAAIAAFKIAGIVKIDFHI